MDADNKFAKRLEDLRLRAETRLSLLQPGETAVVADDTMQKVLHDLHVHQIELEMQNEELREARQDAERSRDRFMSLYHSAPVGYVVTDANGMIVQANRTFSQMVDHDLAALVHQPLSRLIHTGDQAVFFSRFRAFYNNPAGKRLEIRLVTSGGRTVHAAMEGRRTDPDGVSNSAGETPQRLLITISDITQKMAAEKAIIRAKQQWEQTFDAVPDLIAILDDRSAVVRVNQALAKRLGTTPQACVGKHCFEIFHDEKAPPTTCIHQQFLSTGVAVERESFSRKLKGDFLTSVSPYHADDRGQRWCIHISRDVTDRKRAEKELLKLRNLESIGMLAGGIAHDFNNILMALVGNIELAKFGIDDDETRRYLDGALNAAFRARDLANRLLTFAKGGNPHLQSTEIGDLLEATLQLSLCGTNVTHRLILADDLPSVIVDDAQIKSAFQHIITNAREAMPWGGQLTVSVRTATLNGGSGAAMTPGRCLRIDFTDEGEGILPSHIERVFDPYFTTKQMGSRKGMGLGLAICHSIVSRHNGHITIQSEKNHGSTVTVYLPISRRPAKPTAGSVPANASGRSRLNRRLLIMEDEESIWDVLRPVLRRMDCDVDFAPDGETAIRLYRQVMETETPYALLILDLTVRGGMGATEVIRHLQALDPHVRAAVFSGYGTSPVFTDFRRFGFVGALQKPIQVETFRTFVEKLLYEN